MTAQKAVPPDLIDSLLSGYKKPEDLIGEHGLLKQLTKALVECALEAERAAHLGRAKNESVTNTATPAMARAAKPSRVQKHGVMSHNPKLFLFPNYK